MPPARILAAVLLTAAVAAAGIFIAHTTATHPDAATPAVPGVPTPTLTAKPPPQPPGRSTPHVAIDQIPAPRPVLADGHYDTLIPHVDIRHDRAVVDLVQVFYGHAAEQAAIADGKNPATARGATIWISNHNPRLRTLPLAPDLRLDLRDGEFQASHGATLSRLATDAFNTWFTLTVAHGVVVEVQEH